MKNHLKVHFTKVSVLLFLLILPLIPNGDVYSLDLHTLWEDRCAMCHEGDSGGFSRQHLIVENGNLIGRRSGNAVKQFLLDDKHFLNKSEAKRMYDMLLAQNDNSEEKFMNQCSSCHGKAADFVRDSLLRSPAGDVLTHKSQPIDEFLSDHRKLSAEDVAFFTRLFIRIDQEVRGPLGASE